jgi:hypothetical protein
MTGSAKRKTLILLGLVMILMVMIATSLPQLEFQPGLPVPSLKNDQVVIAPLQAEPLVSIQINEFVKVLLALFLACSMLYMLYRLLQGASWKELWTYLKPVILLSLLVTCFIFLAMWLLPKGQETLLVELPQPTPAPLATSPLGTPPPILLWLVGIVLLGSSLLLGARIFISSRKTTTIELVGLEAEKAWQALKSGLDLKDVIVRCYRQMGQALQQEQGLERKDFMTTGEFENLLESAGLPHEPIHQLTRLFEAVRYGNSQPDPADEQRAIHCLEAIIACSQESGRLS